MQLVQRLKQNRSNELNAARAFVELAEKENRELSGEEVKKITDHRAKAAILAGQISETEALGEDLKGLAAVEKPLSVPENPADAFPHKQVQTPVERSHVSRLNAFKTKEKAFRFGMWAAAVAARTLGRDKVGMAAKADRFCLENGIPLAIGTEGVNSDGGYLVPDEFSSEVIDLREKYGVLRQNAKVEPMAKETKKVPVRTGGLTAYLVGETSAMTESTKAWGQVSLVAKKLGVLTRMTSELNEDSLVNLADDLAQEISYTFAYSEDLAGFVGDGTSTYYGWLGLAGTAGAFLTPSKFGQASLTIGTGPAQSNIASLYVGTGNAYSELILKDFQSVIGLLPEYADDEQAAWFVHRTFFYNVMVPLIENASGGLSLEDLQGRGRTKMFLGYPVVFVQSMPKAEANSQVCALLGNLRKACMLGDRRSNRIQFSDVATVGGESMFERDEIGVKGTERVDFNFHSPGNYNTTAASRTPGPLCGLITAAS